MKKQAMLKKIAKKKRNITFKIKILSQMADQSLHQNQEQKQEQVIAPQQIQSLEYLMAQTAELQAKIDKELEENPLLEEEEPSADEDKSEALNVEQSENEEDKAELDAEPIGESAHDVRNSDLFENYNLSSSAEEYSENSDDFDDIGSEFDGVGFSFRDSSSNFSTDPDYDKKRKFLMDSITSKPSLQEQLLEQLRLSSLAQDKMKIAELIIGSIDDFGFLRSHPADLATKEQVEISEIENVIKFVQDNFEPPGICARDLKECFLLQLKAKGMEKSKAAYLVKYHLNDLAHNRRPLIAKKMKISLDELNELISIIKKLNSKPASELSSSSLPPVIPEVFVEKKDEKFIAYTNKNWTPRLRISQKYLNMLEDPTVPQETKIWIKDKLIRAKNIIRTLGQRESTIKRIAEVIIDEQFEFFNKGVENLKPLKMQDVADKLGLHETTISRAIAGKYMQTPKGIYEFKFFFSGGYQSATGEEMSSKSVMEKIREMIDDEDPSEPLSDKDISDRLRKDGLKIARRTVTKYREALGIQSSHMRRQHS